MATVLTNFGSAASAAAQALVASARGGDQPAFEALIEERLAGLFRLALAIVGDEHDARDAVQQACVQAWRELPRLRETDRFDAWLGRILTNACRTTLRSRRRRRVRELAVSELDPSAGRSLADRTTVGPAEAAADAEVLSRAFDRLSPDARILLALHHLQGRSVADIGAAYDLPKSTVKWRLHAARQALERALEAEQR